METRVKGNPFLSNKIGLLDADETLKIKIRINGQSVYTINQTIIDDLIKNDVRDVYLFTNMGFSDLNHVPVLAEGQINYLTRRQLVEYLRSCGIHVHGVITQADVVHDRGLGAAYHLYELAYDDCLEDNKKYQQNKNKLNSYQNQFESYKVSHLPDYNEKYSAASQKKFMFQYFQQQINIYGIEEIHYYEDDITCINFIKELNDKRLNIYQVNNNDPNANYHLLIPYQYENQKIQIEALIKKGQEPEQNLNYELINLPPDVSSYRKSSQQALALMIAFYNYHDGSRLIFDSSAMECFNQTFYNFTLHITEKLNTLESNRAWITLSTFTLALLQHFNPDKYKEIKILPNCEAMFNVLEAIFTHYEKVLKNIAIAAQKELEGKLSLLSNEQKIIVQKNLFLEPMIDDSFNESKKLLASFDKTSIFFWENPNAKTKIAGYQQAIIQITSTIFECDNLLKNNLVQTFKL